MVVAPAKKLVAPIVADIVPVVAVKLQQLAVSTWYPFRIVEKTKFYVVNDDVGAMTKLNVKVN